MKRPPQRRVSARIAGLEQIRWISFDCYGTLVDWRRGLSAGLFQALKPTGRLLPAGAIDRILSAEWELIHEQEEFIPYSELLARAIEEGMASAGVPFEASLAQQVAAGMGSWPLFPDTVEALRRLAARWPLALLSNVDRAQLTQTELQLGIQIGHRITAEDVQCYKPEPDHLLALLHEQELEPEELLHVSAYCEYDLRTAEDLGILSAYVDRRGIEPPDDVTVTIRANDLHQLASQLLAG